MRCREASEMMSLRLDSELHPQEEQALQQHLLMCDSCRAEWEAMECACALFGGVVPTPPPPGLSSRVMAAIGQRESRLAILRNSVALCLGLLILTMLCLSFWITAASPLDTILHSAPLVSAIATMTVGVIDILGTLLRAGALVVRTVLTSPGYVGLMGYVAVAGALVLWWLRIVSGWTRVVRRARTL